MTTVKPLIVIVGETASGKSALAMELAKQFNGEIVCADSWTVYRGFDVGTAKPSAIDRQAVPHHLLDIAEPSAGFSAAVFKREAQRAIADVQERGRLPILAGGSGLYIDSVLYDYGFLEQSDPDERTALNAMELPRLLEYAHELKLDLGTIDIRNKRRVIRHIENKGVKPTRQHIRANTLVLGLRIPSQELSERIERRVDAMITEGLEKETLYLADLYGWEVEPMKGIGYREWQKYFEGSQTFSETRQKIIQNTYRLAKKQRTWFKRNNSIHWINSRGEAVDLVTTFLNN